MHRYFFGPKQNIPSSDPASDLLSLSLHSDQRNSNAIIISQADTWNLQVQRYYPVAMQGKSEPFRKTVCFLGSLQTQQFAI